MTAQPAGRAHHQRQRCERASSRMSAPNWQAAANGAQPASNLSHAREATPAARGGPRAATIANNVGPQVSPDGDPLGWWRKGSNGDGRRAAGGSRGSSRQVRTITHQACRAESRDTSRKIGSSWWPASEPTSSSGARRKASGSRRCCETKASPSQLATA